MAKHIKKCVSCKLFTLKDLCPGCKVKTLVPRPPKFSLSDKYINYKRDVKRKQLLEEGLL